MSLTAWISSSRTVIVGSFVGVRESSIVRRNQSARARFASVAAAESCANSASEKRVVTLRGRLVRVWYTLVVSGMEPRKGLRKRRFHVKAAFYRLLILTASTWKHFASTRKHEMSEVFKIKLVRSTTPAHPETLGLEADSPCLDDALRRFCGVFASFTRNKAG